MWNWLLLSLLYLCELLLAYFTWPNFIRPIPSVYSAITVFGLWIPHFLIILMSPPKKVFWLSGLSGMLAFFPVLLYMINLPSHPYTMFVFILLSSSILFIYCGAFGRLAKRLTSPRLIVGFPFFISCIFVAIQFFNIRGSAHFGLIPYPVLMAAYPLAHTPALIQMASFTGILGLEFLVYFISSCAAFFIFQLLLIVPSIRTFLHLPETVKPLSPKQVFVSFGIQATILCIVSLLFVAGNQEGLHILDLQKKSTRTLTVAQLQPNYNPMASTAVDNRYEEILAIKLYRQMCLEAREKKAELIVFPENIISGRLPNRQKFWSDLQDVLKEIRIPAVLGIITQNPKTSTTYNLWYYFNENAQIADYYTKRFLFPFGEYVPLRTVIDPITRTVNNLLAKNYEIFKITATTNDNTDLTPGKEERIFSLSGKKFFIKVCDELLMPQYFREGTAQGGEVVFVPSNNNWFTTQINHQHHLCAAIFRAVENRRWLGRTMNMGCSFYIDAAGNPRSFSAFGKPAVHLYKIPLLNYQSFYVRHGDVFAWVCTLLAVLISLATFLPFFRPTSQT